MTSPSPRHSGLSSEDLSSQNNPPTEFPTSALRTRPLSMSERITAAIRRRRRHQQLQQQQHLLSLAREQQELQQQLHWQQQRRFQRHLIQQQQQHQQQQQEHQQRQQNNHNQVQQQPSQQARHSAAPRSRRRHGTQQQEIAQGVANSALARVEETRERLAELSSRLTSLGDLLDAATPQSPFTQGTSNHDSHSNATRSTGQQHRAKRRKLKHGADVQKQAKNGIRYGHYGSVVPGQLMLEIVSCDGGEYANDCLPSYAVENVLRNDPSVYCTKRSRCNLMLRHQGEVAFTLEKIVIEAPKREFTAPVQQGLIFLSMTSDNLIRDTKVYEKLSKTVTSTPSSSRASQSPLDEGITLLESLHDPEVASRHEHNAAVAALGSFSDFPFSFDVNAASDASYHRRNVNPRPTSSHGSGADDDFHYEWPLTEPESRPPALAVTVSNDSDTDMDLDNDFSATEIARRMRRRANNVNQRRPLRQTSSIIQSENEDGEIDYENGIEHDNFNLIEDDELDMTSELFPQPPAGHPDDHGPRNNDNGDDDARERRTNPAANSPSHREEPSATGGSGGDGNNLNRPADSGQNAASASASVSTPPPASAPYQRTTNLIQPHARFSRALNKGKVTVKFDPPISCKFILLKLWSPLGSGNIDVQSVTAHGFAGPRYFPACKLR